MIENAFDQSITTMLLAVVCCGCAATLWQVNTLPSLTVLACYAIASLTDCQWPIQIRRLCTRLFKIDAHDDDPTFHCYLYGLLVAYGAGGLLLITYIQRLLLVSFVLHAPDDWAQHAFRVIRADLRGTSFLFLSPRSSLIVGALTAYVVMVGLLFEFVAKVATQMCDEANIPYRTIADAPPIAPITTTEQEENAEEDNDFNQEEESDDKEGVQEEDDAHVEYSNYEGSSPDKPSVPPAFLSSAM